MSLLDHLQRVKLRWNLVIWYTLALMLVSGLMILTITDRIRTSLDESLEKRGQSILSSFVAGTQISLGRPDSDTGKLLESLFEDEDLAYAALLDPEGNIIVSRFGRKHDAELMESVFMDWVESIVPGLRMNPGRIVRDDKTIKHFADAVFSVRSVMQPGYGENIPIRGEEEPKPGEIDSNISRDEDFSEETIQENDPPVKKSEESSYSPEASKAAADTQSVDEIIGTDKLLGFVVFGLSKDSNTEAMMEVIAYIGGTLALGFILFVVLSFFLISRFFILKPISAMQGFARRMSEYDLTGKAEKYADDELGEMADALNRLGENLRGVLRRIQGVTDSLTHVADRVATTSEVVSRGAASTASSLDQTGSSMQEMLASLKGIAENVELLAGNAEESSTSIIEMAATNDETAKNIKSLALSVEETTTAIEKMTYSIKEVAGNIEELSATTEETSSSMNQMDVSISQVEVNANETAKLSEQVSYDAGIAGEALQKTIAGIDKIRDSSRTASDVIEALGKKIGKIGSILNVIDEVAEQTNLLALNAAIIAAQAGEHGKGFAVVADEIKDLAERTGASTKEIADLIRAVQAESGNAIQAMEKGVINVDEGVRLSGDADAALKKILESAGRSTQMVKAIARATLEQAKGSKQVTGAINRIAETVQEISRATSEQAGNSEQIMNSAEKMKVITKHVERSSQEQARGSRQITNAMERISDMVSQLNIAQREQTRGAEQVMLAVENIKDVADNQNLAVKDLESAVDTLSDQSDVLRGEVQRFRV